MRKILITCITTIILLSTFLLCFNGSKDATFQTLKNNIYEEKPVGKSETKSVENVENIIEENGRISGTETSGGLPVFAIVWCRWSKIHRNIVERKVHFLVRGRGYHKIEWQIYDDFDGDGAWDFKDSYYTKQRSWVGICLPFRHYTDWVQTKGYYGSSKVMVNYWIDGKEFTKTFINS